MTTALNDRPTLPEKENNNPFGQNCQATSGEIAHFVSIVPATRLFVNQPNFLSGHSEKFISVSNFPPAKQRNQRPILCLPPSALKIGFVWL
ncbi:MAG: hypothetical protein ACYSR9_14280 [Planctomycetota bacterium]